MSDIIATDAAAKAPDDVFAKTTPRRWGMKMTGHDYRWMRMCALAMIPFLILTGIFWGILGYNIPPFDAATPADDLAGFFREHGTRLRIAYAVAVPSWTFLMIWTVSVFGLMRRMTGPNALLPYLQLLGGSLTSMVPAIASVFWLAAAMRPERPPALTQLLYDLGWLTIDLIFLVTTIQYVAAGIVFLQDKRSVPLIPKWLSWIGIWLGVEFIAEFLMPNFRSGPFSWAGLFNYWIPFFGPFTWMVVLTIFMMRAFTRLEREDAENVCSPGATAATSGR